MGRWETRHGNQFTTSGSYTASSAAMQPVQEQFALFAVVHPQARACLLGLSSSPVLLQPGRREVTKQPNYHETSMILLILGQGISIRM